jgi:cytochrome P450
MSRHESDPSLPPKRTGLPVLGSAVSFGRDPYAFYDDVASHGDVVRFSMGSYDMVGVLHPDAIEEVLVEKFDQFRKPDAAGGVDVLADGLLLADGEQWQAQRTRLQPMFYRERIETYGETMATYAAAVAEEWAATEGTVDLNEATSTYTLQVLGKTLFGVDTDEHRRAIRAGAEAILERSSQNPVSVDLPDWLPTPSNRRYRRGIDQLDRVVDDLIEKTDGDGDSQDILSVLVAASAQEEDGPTESEIRSQLMTFLFAGHETSATALTWALYELGRKPAVADRLHSEVDAVLDGATATLADLPELTYTDQVLRETLRRYPPAAAIFREADEDVTVGGYRVPEDTFVVLPQFHVHTDERWWDDPEQFEPARWDDISEPPGDRPEYSYFPFGGGPRHCIGMRFARMELKLALATIARNCRISHDHAVPIDVGSTVHPGETIRATVRRRG